MLALGLTLVQLEILDIALEEYVRRLGSDSDPELIELGDKISGLLENKDASEV